MKTEICTWNMDTIQYAASLKVDRIELCSALVLGGLTPSYGLIEASVAVKNIETHVMIRPKAGTFVVSESELQIMKSDIKVAAKLGAKGVVFGCLNEDGALAIKNTSELCILAQTLGLKVTFHRAFDFVKNPFDVMEQLIALKVDRILTAGQKSEAIAGIDLIQALVKKANGRIEIMAGAGIIALQVNNFKAVNVNAIHFSGDKVIKAKSDIDMGKDYTTNHEKIQSILNEL